MKLNDKVIEWTYFGTEYSSDASVKRHIIFSNVIFLTLPIVYVAFIFIDLDAFLEPANFFKFDRLIVPLAILGCLLFVMLNKVGHTSVSRVLFLLSWPILFHILPIIIHQSPSDYYFAFPAGIIFHSVLIHVSISAKREPWKFWSFLTANFILMILAKDFLVAHDITPESENVLRADPYFVLDIILYWLLFNLLAYYVFYVVEYYIGRLTRAKATIDQQHEELAEKNEELQQAISSLQAINHHVEDLNRNLENKVSERTQELKEKNAQLVEYAHLNAHLLRGPFCRVKGLVLLRETISPPGDEEKELNALLMQSIDELDEVTRRIQRTVEVNEPKK